MSDHWQDDSFFILYAIMSIISICASISLLSVFILKTTLRTPHIMRIFWMVLCDLGLSLRHMIEFVYYHPTMDNSPAACTLSAWLGAFFITATSSWYFVISVATFRTFLGKPLVTSNENGSNEKNQVSIWEHIYVWGLSLFSACYPWLQGYFGPTEDDGTCWITQDHRYVRLIITIPLFIYLLFAAGLLILVLVVSRTLLGKSDARSRVLKQMVFFVGVFFFTWSWTLMDNIYGIAGAIDKRPEIIRYLDSIAVSGSGFFNFLVWSSSGSIHRALCGPRLHQKLCPWVNVYISPFCPRYRPLQNNDDTEKGSEAQLIVTQTSVSDTTCLSTQRQIQAATPLLGQDDGPILNWDDDDDTYYF